MTLLGKLICFALAASVTAVPFVFYELSPTDPEYHDVVKKLKAVLSKEGLIDVNHIIIKQLQMKNELYRTTYTARFFTGDGKLCDYHWRQVLYSSSSIAAHECITVPTAFPQIAKKKKTTTTTEEPTTTESSAEETTTSGEGTAEASSEEESTVIRGRRRRNHSQKQNRH